MPQVCGSGAPDTSWHAVGVTDEPAFTVSSARADLARLLPVLDEFVSLRATAALIGAALSPGGRPTGVGGLAEFKAAQARLDEILSGIQAAGVQIKGVAPLLLDFPSVLDGEDVLLCWLEGDRELRWYHRLDLGFAGRRPLPR